MLESPQAASLHHHGGRRNLTALQPVPYLLRLGKKVTVTKYPYVNSPEGAVENEGKPCCLDSRIDRRHVDGTGFTKTTYNLF